MEDERTVPIMVIKGHSLAICLYIILLITGVLVHLYGQQTNAGANAVVAIPDEAIRLRILANSDADKDQQLKRKVRDAVNAQINGWVAELTSVDEAKRVIRSHLPEIEQTVARVLREEQSSQSYHVQFGSVQFPTKVYGNYVYPAGTYDALLITLGEGKGANWWCVLFPPLCFLDFSNGDAVMMAANRSPAGTNEPVSAESVRSMEAGSTQNSEAAEAEAEAMRSGEQAIEQDEPKEERDAMAETEDRAASSIHADGEKDKGDTDDQESSFVVMAEPEQPVEVKFFFKEWLSHLIP
ncbi:stage II sporulation protein R [Geobacillus sp. FSL K6-0789]|uniref:Stage II sporulation protein R n=1 Tax=Geobacillus stearothermophilus TaxID=1422 RepID=A0A3L7DDS8_GEOSE|nr:stage II sporulation protein R [Geobacillus stearothermophilus]MED3720413.1 stage II sporulation protein R [Geobacillus stearothermophilus]RLQ08974.1 stage II sporulation protein R [Geobacillus stearothermophilus]RLQ11276.1 stage II sporulation protein R [Geobacillus stearothermophilus]RLQ14403.1 stage II sporulation protein R [Geobacillus stearothermophilus]